MRSPPPRIFRLSSQSLIAELDARFQPRLHRPEAVTFEEMNVQGPVEVIRIIIRSAHVQTKGKKAARSSERRHSLDYENMPELRHSTAMGDVAAMYLRL